MKQDPKQIDELFVDTQSESHSESKVTDTDRLVSRFINMNRLDIRLLTPDDTDKIALEQSLKMTPRMSGASLLLLSEEIPSNAAAEMDPTFKKPVLLPPFKRPKKSKVSKIIIENELEEEEEGTTLQSRVVSRESSAAERNISFRPKTISREASVTDKNSLTRTSTPHQTTNEYIHPIES